MAICFLDTEFADLQQPELLSLELVTLQGNEHYVELDLSTDIGRVRKKAASDFVRHGGVLDMWGRVPGAACTEWKMGRRTGEWLLEFAGKSGARVEVAFNYPYDFELLEHVIREPGLWDRVREFVWPVDIDRVTWSIAGEFAAECSYRETGRRGLKRHHALGDALALRRSYMAAKEEALQAARDRESR